MDFTVCLYVLFVCILSLFHTPYLPTFSRIEGGDDPLLRIVGRGGGRGGHRVRQYFCIILYFMKDFEECVIGV